MQTDYSQLENFGYECIDGCAMCCLCQPELSEEELKAFTSRGFEKQLTRHHVDGRRSQTPSAIRLQGGHGACSFLKDRQCQTYDIRPRYCRQFPVHVHALRRIQLIPNLACRGITEGGGGLLKFGKEVLAEISEEELAGELAQSGKLADEFQVNALKHDVWQDEERLRSVARKCLPILAESDGIGKLLGFADKEPHIGDTPEAEVVAAISETDVPDDLEIIARLANYEQFEIANIAWLPVYVDDQLRWNLIQSKNDKVRWIELSEDGSTKVMKSYKPDEIVLLPRSADALDIFANYAGTLIERDHFLGYAYYICAQEGYSDDLMTVYFGLLATALLDLWWRASLIAKTTDKTEIDGHLAREAIIAFDMGMQESPSVGTFF